MQVNSLETPVTQHCNLKCAGCDHASPLLPQSFLDIDQFERDLDVLNGAMHAHEFRLVGGEPLQHPELQRIIGIVKKSGIAERIVLVTNGVLLGKATPELWRSIDQLWMSIYPRVSLGLPLEEIEGLCRENGVEFDPRVTDEFRVVLLNNPIDNPKLVSKIYRECKTAHEWKCYTVLDGQFFKCSKASVMNARLRMLGIPHDAGATNGVALHSGAGLEQRLQAYIQSQEALPACRFCLGTSGPLVAHRQLNARGVEAAKREDHSTLIQQLG
jgi:hypothetical protein